MIKLFFFCGSICLLATGCVFTRTETQVNFSPMVNQPLNAQKKTTLAVGEFTDSRLVQDKYVLFHKTDGYGNVTSGAYVTKEPVADILKKGLAEALQKNDFIGGDSGRYELHGDLQLFDGGVINGFWKTTAKAQITVRFELVEKNSGQPVWHDTFTGQTTKDFVFANKDFYASLFSDAATELAKRLIADKTFRSFFE